MLIATQSVRNRFWRIHYYFCICFAPIWHRAATVDGFRMRTIKISIASLDARQRICECAHSKSPVNVKTNAKCIVICMAAIYHANSGLNLSKWQNETKKSKMNYRVAPTLSHNPNLCWMNIFCWQNAEKLRQLAVGADAWQNIRLHMQQHSKKCVQIYRKMKNNW